MKENRYETIWDLDISRYIETKRISSDIVKIEIERPLENMQSDYADFEAICLMYKCIENNIKIIIEYDIPEIRKRKEKISSENSDTNKYFKFIFRLIMFKNAYPDWIDISPKNMEEINYFKEIYNEEIKKEKITNNYPDKCEKFNLEKGVEHQIEKKIIHTEEGRNYLKKLYKNIFENDELINIYGQLPNGLFNCKTDEKPNGMERIFPTGYFDIWGIDDKNNFCIFELKKDIEKDRENRELGIISQLFFYAVYSKEILCNKKCINKYGIKKPYRGYEKLYEIIENSKINKIKAVFLTGESIYPAIKENKKELIELLNSNKLNENKPEIEFCFMKYDKNKIDEISEEDIKIEE